MQDIIDQFLTSSEDSAKLSARFTGLLIASSSFIVYLAGVNGISITTDQIQAVAGQLGVIAGVMWSIFGFLRYFANLLGNKYLWNK